MNGVPWWFFDRLAFGGGKLRLETLDPAAAGARHADRAHRRLRDPPRRLAAGARLVSHNMGRKLILGEPGGRNGLRTKNIADALTAAASRSPSATSSKRILGQAPRQRELQPGLGLTSAPPTA
jgi:2-dehydropantoate 2-reductase